MSDKRIDAFKIQRPEARPSRFQALLLFAIAAAGLFVSLLPELCLKPLIEASPGVGELLIQLIYNLPFVALPVAILLWRRPKCFDAFRPNPLGGFTAAMIVFIALVAVLFISDLEYLWAIPWEEAGIDLFASSNSYVPATRGQLLLRILSAGVIPAICEEALFRGVILSALEPCGTKRAMIFSSLLFAALHGSLAGLPGELLAGLLMAFLVITTDSIYAGIIFHTVYNSAAVIIQYMQRNLPAAEGSVLTQLGGASGMLALVFEMLMLLLPVSALLRIFAMFGRARGLEPFPPVKEKRTTGETLMLALVLLLIVALYGFAIISYFEVRA